MPGREKMCFFGFTSMRPRCKILLSRRKAVSYTHLRLEYVQLLPYHKLGTETYKKLGRPYLLEDVQSPTKEEMDRCRDIVRQYVKKVI